MNDRTGLLRFKGRYLILAAALLLAGCGDFKGLIGPPPAPQLYALRLPAPAPAAGGGPSTRWQLAVAEPEASSTLDSERIALNPTPSTIDYFANSAWPDRVPVVLQGLLVEAFERTGRVSVARDTAGLAPDYVLETEVRDFEAIYDTPPVAGQPGTSPHIMVQIQAKLIAIPDRRIIGTVNVMQRVDAAENSMDAIVAAFNQALSAAIGQIVDWTMKTPPAA